MQSSVLQQLGYFDDEKSTEHFYVDILGMRLLDRRPGHSLFFRAGSSVYLLFKTEESRKGQRLPSHGARGPIHTCFRVLPEEYERWEKYLVSKGVEILHNARWAQGLSFYFHDPSGNLLEIANNDIWPS